MNHKQQLGKKGENSVADYLEKNGFSIATRNYRYRTGEIDLIAQQKNLLVFVEVKLRTHVLFDLSQVITPSKQRKIITTAKQYLLKNNPDHNTICRFDVALIDTIDNTLTYLQDAFRDHEY